MVEVRHPFEGYYSSNWIISPTIGVKIKKIGNHHLVKIENLEICDSLRVFSTMKTIFFCQDTPVLQNLRVSKAANDEGRNAVLLAQTTGCRSRLEMERWECCGWRQECKNGQKWVKTHVMNMKTKDWGRGWCWCYTEDFLGLWWVMAMRVMHYRMTTIINSIMSFMTSLTG